LRVRRGEEGRGMREGVGGGGGDERGRSRGRIWFEIEG
jgi:hypothetical protein